MFISFHRVAEWWSYGLVKIQPVAKIPGFRNSVRDAAEIAPRALRIDATALRAQGGESMTGFVYINLEKVPAGGSDAP